MTVTEYPYQDASLPVEQRVDDLLSRMSLADKAGQMFQPLGPIGTDFDKASGFGSPSLRQILDRGITHMNILDAGTAREVAEWHNAIQREALARRLGIPFTISSDPRHAFSSNPMAAMFAGPFSQWPETLGLGALDDPELTRQFADIVRREYVAVGIRVALHPQIDLASEPRWARANGTFGSSAEVSGRLGVAYVLGLQGGELGASSVSAMAKHFPGGGPQLNGEDPHFDYGREQVYPGGRFDEHLQPFREVIAAGVRQIMPYYGMPVGTEFEEVGFSFNKQIVTGLLREQLGFDGIVCSDWGILSRTFWGVEALSYEERMIKALDAGVDQFGGEFRPRILVELVQAGRVSEARLDVSVRRLLREKFTLGLFDEARFVDPDAAELIVGTTEARAQGVAAQSASITLLKNDGAVTLPLAGQPTVYVEGLAAEALAGWANVVPTPDEADLAIVRIDAPWEERGVPGEIEYFFHAGSLAFGEAKLAHLREVADAAPLVVDVYLDRPAILAPIAAFAAVVIANYGASDEALTNVLFGAAEPKGRLPFEIPSSMVAVEQNLADVPNDTVNPTYPFGHGLRFTGWVPASRPDPTTTTARVMAPASRFDLVRTPLAALLQDPEASAILTELMPDLPAHPMIELIKGMPVESVLAMATDEAPSGLLQTLRERLTALPPR